MAYILEALIEDPGDSTIKVGHTFYGLTEQECRTYYREHLANDEYLAAAQRDGRTFEDLEEVDEDELPDADELAEEYEEDDEDDEG